MSKKTLIFAAAGSAFVAGLAAAPIASAAENPFALSSLTSGYQVADSSTAKSVDDKGGSMKSCDGKCGAAMMDTDKDGKVSKEEFNKAHEAMFDSMDTNKDGSLDKAEMDKMMDGKYGGGKKAMEGKCGGMK